MAGAARRGGRPLMFLTPDEVYRITRKKQRAAQCRVLKAKGYAYEPDAAGWPLVLKSTVEKRHGTPAGQAARGPDSAALAALQGSR